MASFLTVIILGVADVQKMALAGGHSFLLSVSCPFCEVSSTDFQWCSVFLERKTACWDLTGSSVIKLHPKIIAFCKTRY